MPQFLVEGLDPTPLACISKSDILQMVRNSYPVSPYGWVVVSDSAPDVVTTPILARFIWLKSVAGVLNGEFYYWNGTSWTLLSITSGANLTAHTVTVDKLSLTGTSPYFIIQVNAAGDNWQVVSIPTAIQSGSLVVGKLEGGGIGTNKILASLNNVNQYIAATALAALFPNESFTLAKLERKNDTNNYLVMCLSGVNQFVLSNTIVDYIVDDTLAISKLDSAGATGLQSIRRNSGNTAWEFYTPSFSFSRFSAHKNVVNQSIPNNILTKVTFGAEAFDSANYYDIINSRFTAGAAGIYQFYAIVTFEDTEAAVACQVDLVLKRNGLLDKESYVRLGAPALSYNSITVSAILSLSLNDYIEVFVNQQAGVSMDISGATAVSYFEGFQIA